MPAKRKAMRKIKEVLRLKFEVHLSHERIAAAVGVSKGAVTNNVRRAVAAGLGWPLDPEPVEQIKGLQMHCPDNSIRSSLPSCYRPLHKNCGHGTFNAAV